jgi:protein involved in polysaccharide export with SLBB domain
MVSLYIGQIKVEGMTENQAATKPEDQPKRCSPPQVTVRTNLPDAAPTSRGEVRTPGTQFYRRGL